MQMRPFQIILIGIFLALAVGGVITFALFRGFGGDVNPYGERVEIWGTLDRNAFANLIESIRIDDRNFDVVSYRELDPRSFQNEFVNAVAEGRGPDLVVIPNDLLIAERGKLTPIPYESLPERAFRDTYVDGAEILLAPEGVYGIPFAVDPLVMYWNRARLASEGLATPPKTWEELVARTLPATVERTPSLEIIRSTVAFGEYSNVSRAKATILMLMLQTGTELVTIGNLGYTISLDAPSPTGAGSGEAALRFYTEFSNPSRATYSWNRALPNDRDEFLAGDLALYFGFGSEIREIENGNPNLDFDVAEVPQGAEATLRRGYGTFYAFAIPKSSVNISGAYQAALRLGTAGEAASLAERFDFAPVHRQIIGAGTGDPFRAVLFNAALVARGWLDPDPRASDNVLKQMIEDITSGRTTIGDALGDAEGRLRQLLP